jgi:hypothetical protein
LLAVFAAVEFGVVLTEALASVKDLLTVGTAPCEPLLVELFFVRLPIWL